MNDNYLSIGSNKFQFHKVLHSLFFSPLKSLMTRIKSAKGGTDMAYSNFLPSLKCTQNARLIASSCPKGNTTRVLMNHELCFCICR